ncbi:hypothetical protein QYE76_007631 [Lolium multiflorum]|uniref:CCHC-type domain-containing protein n=1 Tax=Lolium multiflorum TaxID=4521 RepID=A0AAD8VFV4_LOLMU|nr:hypothetical protein QYE76_007631 [Lolium multiflorum]
MDEINAEVPILPGIRTHRAAEGPPWAPDDRVARLGHGRARLWCRRPFDPPRLPFAYIKPTIENPYGGTNMNKELPELFAMLKSAEIEIKKEHQVLMVNKTTRFKKQGKSKGKNKKSGKKAATPHENLRRPKPDVECYYCKEKGHWKRNCSKYLADLKSGLVKKKKKGISDIHVIDVYLIGSRTAWVFDTGSVAHICNSKQELKNKRRLLKDEVTMHVGN